jgi:hypothetical protein
MTPQDPRIATILSELYQMDKTLKNHEEALLRIITKLDETKPHISIDEAYVADLRASLLAYKQPVPTTSIPTPYPFSWWLPRIAPIGVALVVLVLVVVPGQQKPVEREFLPANETTSTYSTDSNDSIGDSESVPAGAEVNTFDAFMSEPAMTAPQAKSMVAMPIEVNPPYAGNLLTIQNLAVTQPGWLVVYEDQGGNFGNVLYRDRINPGLHTNLPLTLGRPVQYGEMVTVAIYTARNSGTFVVQNETIQTDPVSGVPLMVTVPVVSELEMPLGQ